MNESTEIGEITAVNSLALTAPTPLTEHPAAVYLSGLSPGSRSAMGQALNAIARILTSNQCDALTLNWAELRYKHTALLRCI
ncbi:MAG: integrase, partial [Cuspidothrix sp.]